MQKFATLNVGLATTALSLLLAGCSLKQHAGPTIEVSEGLVIRNVSVVDTYNGAVSPGRAIVIRNGVIQQIVATGAVRAGAAAQEVDGRGGYVVPGYVDMHAHAVLPPAAAHAAAPQSGHDHAPQAAAAKDAQQNYWRLMIANGVTGFREMSGSAQLIRLSHEFNAASKAGKIDAPEVLQVPGDLYVGQVPAAGAAAFVRAQADAGADFFKLLAGPRDGVLAALQEASRRGMTVAGHLPDSITAREAVDGGWDAIEHMGAGWGFALDCADAAPAIRERLASRPPGAPQMTPQFLLNPILYTGNAVAPVYRTILASYNEGKCRQLAQLFRERNVWHVPTLIRIRTMHHGGDAVYRNDQNLEYLDPKSRATWKAMGAEFEASIPAETSAVLRSMYAKQAELAGMLQREGVGILAGSDLGGIWILPGFGLHQEFRELAKAGFTPLQVLQATTLNAARFLGREATMGSVAAGKEADLVLLDANPIDHVGNLDRIAGVVLNGKYFSQDALDAMKARVTADYAE